MECTEISISIWIQELYLIIMRTVGENHSKGNMLTNNSFVCVQDACKAIAWMGMLIQSPVY